MAEQEDFTEEEEVIDAVLNTVIESTAPETQVQPSINEEEEKVIDAVLNTVIEETAPTLEPEESDGMAELGQYFADTQDDPESLEPEETFEDEDGDAYQPGSLEDYGLQALGGVADTISNMGEMAYIPEAHEAINEVVESYNIDSDKLVFNFKGFKNYDPSKPSIFFMSDEEWDKLHAEDKVSFMPAINKSSSTGAGILRSVSNIASALFPASKLLNLKALGAPSATSSTAVKVAQKFGGFTAVGTLGSVFAFKPYEPRLANSMVDFVKDTPFEVTQPFFEWMQSDDSNSALEERFLIALESVILDGLIVTTALPAVKLFSTTAKAFKRERKLIKAEAGGALPEELQVINDMEVASIKTGDISDMIYPPSFTPLKVKSRETIAKLKESSSDGQNIITVGALDDTTNKTVVEAVSLSTEGVNNAVKALAKAAAAGENVGASASMVASNRQPIINLKMVQSTGVKNVVNALANEIDREARALGKVLIDDQGRVIKNVSQNTKKSFKQTRKDALPYAKWIQRRTSFEETNFVALRDRLNTTDKELFKIMQTDIMMADQIGSRTLAWQMVLDDLTEQVYTSLKGRDLSDVFVQDQATEMLKVVNELWNAFSEIPRGTARALASRRIMMDKKYLKRGKNNTQIPKSDADLTRAEVVARNIFLQKQMKNGGMNKEMLATIEGVMGLAPSALERSRALNKAMTTGFKSRKAMLEMYRGLLLTNLKTITTNFVGNSMETLMIPLARTIGHMTTANLGGVKEELGFLINTVMSLKKATRGSLDSLIHERNLLDPLRTKAESFNSDQIRGFYMQMDKVSSAGYWHPQNWVPLLVNTTGKVGRASLRVLGAQDEFFKLLNYNGKAISKITKVMPEGLSRAEKKEFVSRHLSMFYDDAGKAVDTELLEYSRRAVFQEDLEKGMINSLHKMVNATPEMGLFFPFLRTPANLVSRALQRTPVANFMSERTKRMWRSGNKDERAEVIGNTIIGTGIFATALGYSMEGKITGRGPIDPVKNKLWRAAGFKPFHIKVGETWQRYDRLEPLMLPFMYVSSLHENLYRYNNRPEDLMDAIGVFLAVSARTLVDMTFVRGLKGFMDGFDTIQSNNDASGVEYLLGFVKNAIPAGINQAHRRSGLADEESGAYSYREAISWQDKMMSKLPPSEGYDAIRHNWLTGKPMLLPSGSDYGMDSTKEEPSKYMEELLRFGPNIEGVSKKIGEAELSSEQYAELTRLTGSTKLNGLTMMEQIERVMDSPAYDFDDTRIYHPEFKSEQQLAIDDVISTYKEEARFKLLKEDKTLKDEWNRLNTEKAKVGLGIEN
jgi:hypothetical protein